MENNDILEDFKDFYEQLDNIKTYGEEVPIIEELTLHEENSFFSCFEDNDIEPQKELFSNIEKHDFEKGTYYTNVLTSEELFNKTSNEGEHIFLTGGVGTGKSTLLKELVTYSDKTYGTDTEFFYLCNRSKLEEQMHFDEPVTKRTYQAFTCGNVENFPMKYLDFIEQDMQNARLINPNKRFYFLCDELQYLIADASFNKETKLLFDFIIRHQHDIAFIMLTANGDEVIEFLTKGIKLGNYANDCLKNCSFTSYYIPADFSHYKGHYFYFRITQIINIIKHSKGKVVIGSNDNATWYAIQKEFIGEVCFIQSKHEPDKSDKERYDRWKLRQEHFVEPTKGLYISNRKGDYFTSRILVTTSALDNGVSIIDPNNEIKTVFCEFKDPLSIYQFLGRVRRLQGKEPNQQLAELNVFYKILRKNEFIEHHDKLTGKKEMKDKTDLSTLNAMEMERLKYDVRLVVELMIKMNQLEEQQQNYSFTDLYLKHYFYDKVFKHVDDEITIESASIYLKQLGIEENEQERLNQIKEETNRQKQLLNQVIGKQLSTEEFRQLAIDLNFKRKRKLVMKPYKEIESLGYKVQKPTNNKRYTTIGK